MCRKDLICLRGMHELYDEEADECEWMMEAGQKTLKGACTAFSTTITLSSHLSSLAEAFGLTTLTLSATADCFLMIMQPLSTTEGVSVLCSYIAETLWWQISGFAMTLEFGAGDLAGDKGTFGTGPRVMHASRSLIQRGGVYSVIALDGKRWSRTLHAYARRFLDTSTNSSFERQSITPTRVSSLL